MITLSPHEILLGAMAATALGTWGATMLGLRALDWWRTRGERRTWRAEMAEAAEAGIGDLAGGAAGRYRELLGNDDQTENWLRADPEPELELLPVIPRRALPPAEPDTAVIAAIGTPEDEFAGNLPPRVPVRERLRWAEYTPPAPRADWDRVLATSPPAEEVRDKAEWELILENARRKLLGVS